MDEYILTGVGGFVQTGWTRWIVANRGPVAKLSPEDTLDTNAMSCHRNICFARKR
jgi:hypothetical protein